MSPPYEQTTPVGDGPPDLVRRIFLDVVDPRDCYLRLSWQTAGKFDVRAGGEYAAGLGLQEQLGYIACLEPFIVGSHDRSHVGWLALDGYLPGKGQRRTSPLAGLGERPPVLRHFLVGKGAQDGIRQNLLDEEVV